MRYLFRFLCALSLFISGAVAADTTASQSTRPNIVFILADDLGWMDISPNNPKCFYQTPQLERLARSGVRFTQAYAACCVCSPTRYSIQTGKYPTRVRLTSWLGGNPTRRFQGAEVTPQMALEEVTIAEALRESHYRTAFVGKWHLGGEEQYWPEHQGYDLNIGGWSRGSPLSYFSPYKNPRLPDGPPGEHLPKRLVDESIRFVKQSRNEPFFLFLSFYSVHTPLQGRPDLVDKYAKLAGATASSPASDEFAEEEQVWPDTGPRLVRIRQRHPVYAAMVEAMDEQIGRLLDALDELKIADNTMIVFTSDNGGVATSEGLPTSNLPLRAGKGWLYEGGIREPLLIRWPGAAQAGRTCAVPVISTDYYPTILEAAGLPPRPQQHLDGVSLAPVLKGAETSVPRSLYWQYPHYANQGGFPGGAIRNGYWKLIERYEDGRVQLYNLADDLGEQHDLAREQPDRVQTLLADLHRWYKEVGAKFLRAREGGPASWQPG